MAIAFAQKTKSKKGGAGDGRNRILITVNVLGCAGPLRSVVDVGELVASVIANTLKSYAKEGRLPVLGSNIDDFFLYCAHTQCDALSPLDTIGSSGSRNFVLCKKPNEELVKQVLDRKGSGNWKTWLNKSFKMISSH
ncbi:hypothetical protein QJS04_geneDACA014833 [Acorus gramineus]|uniref:DUF7054 domain-containing protein n=1 Tax=Acorus gramineus TaxID=55184 RepID=A0AAV9BQW3_ACOGR|nr:hypothetical protein QJS04_geneDACA016819 [Acorus gramineus]KAK1278939.1 hypothetical protein QJS04_geneDACA014833 [Acorus gramineus]